MALMGASQGVSPLKMLPRISRSKWIAITLLVTALLLFGLLRRLSSNPFRAATKQASTKAETDTGPDYWGWETSTRFRTPHAIDPNATSDDVCASFPTDILPRIQIVLKTGATEPADRIETHLSSVTRCIFNLLIVSDREAVLHGHRVHDVLADLPASTRAETKDFEAYDAIHRGDGHIGGAAGWKLDRFKFLPMIERAKQTNPSADWFVFLETDTYFVWDNLFRLLDQFDPSVPMYMGSPAPGRKLPNGEKVWFAYGGAGIILSKAAVDKLVNSWWQFFQPSLSLQHHEEFNSDCCGDSVLGSVLYEKGVTLSGLWPMFNPHPLHGIPFDEVQWCQPVITTHKTRLEDMAGLAEWENRRNRTVCLYKAKCWLYAFLTISFRLHCSMQTCSNTSSSVTLMKRKTGTTRTGVEWHNPLNLLLTPHSKPAGWHAISTMHVTLSPMILPDIAYLFTASDWEHRRNLQTQLSCLQDGTMTKSSSGVTVIHASSRCG